VTPETVANADASPRLSANCFTACITGLNRAIGAAAEVIAVAEAAGHDDAVGVVERGFLVPDVTGGVAEPARAWMASWSQLDAGNWRTAKFIFQSRVEVEGRERALALDSRLFVSRPKGFIQSSSL